MDTSELIEKLLAGSISGIQLKDADDWPAWMDNTKAAAERRNVWQYINPDVDDKQLPISPKNRWYPKPEDFHDEGKIKVFKQLNPGQTFTEGDLSRAERREYSEELDKYNKRLEEYEKRLQEVMNIIRNTISESLKGRLSLVRDPRKALYILRTRFEKTPDAARIEVLRKWDRMKLYANLNSPSKVNEWCDKWISLYNRCQSLNAFDHPIIPIVNFIDVTSVYNEDFYISYDKKVKKGKDIDFTTMVDEFRDRKIFRPAMLGYQQNRRYKETTFYVQNKKSEHDENNSESGSNDDNNNSRRSRKGKNSNNNSEEASKRQKSCLICNLRHSTLKCWALNSDDAPDDWSLNQRVKDFIFKSLSKEENRRKIIELYEKHRSDVDIKSRINEFNMERPKERACMAMSFSSTSGNSQHSLYKSIVADNGSSCHITNDLSRLKNLRKALPTDGVFVGNTENRIEYWGELEAYCKMPNGSKATILMRDCAYVEGFHANIFSLQKAEDADIHFNGRKKLLEWGDGDVLCALEKHYGFYTIEFNEMSEEDMQMAASFATKFKRSAQPKVLVGSRDLWHQRMGHLNSIAVSKLAELSKGIEILEERDEHGVELKPKCIPCHLAEAPRQISRIPMPIASKPFDIVYFDMIILKSSAWNQQRYISHFYDAATKTHWAVHHLDKAGCVRAVLYMVNLFERQYNRKVKTLHTDGEKALLGGEFDYLNSYYGLHVNVTVPDTPEQNGPAERAGGVLMKRARALHLESGLPSYLEGEAIKASVYIVNRTPTTDANNIWFIPLQRLYDTLEIPRSVDMSNMYLYGCMAFYRRKVLTAHKLSPRAGIGYLVGYEAHNIWRLWNPKKQPKWSVFRARDVVFDESRKYQKDDPLLTADLRYSEPLPAKTGATHENPYNTVSLPFFVGLEEEEESNGFSGSTEPSNSANHQESVEVCDLEDQPQEGEVRSDENGNNAIQNDMQNAPLQESENAAIMQQDMPQVQSTNEITSSFEVTNDESVFEPLRQSDARTPPTSINEEASFHDKENTDFDLPGGFPRLPKGDLDNEDDYTTPTPNSPVESDHEEAQDDSFDHTLEGTPLHDDGDEIMEEAPLLSAIPMKRSSSRIAEREARNRTKIHRSNYAQLLDAKVENYRPFYIAISFAIRQARLIPPDMKNLHKRNIPKAPETWNELLRHPLRKQFEAAMQVEWDDLWKFGVFETVHIPKRKLIIPQRWVFAYKFDAEGHVMKFKARLVVRGDLQPSTGNDTAAATLAARVFRLMMALAAAWDLEIMQFDVQNAFIQGLMDEEVYVEFPNGYKAKNRALKLLRPLYGLRRSPRIWQKDISSKLAQYGLKQVPDEPCLWKNDYLIVIFFVDDVLVMHRKTIKARKEADKFVLYMETTYKIRREGDGAWFLNIRIIRDRKARKIWLVQDSYIDSLVKRYNLPILENYPTTPFQGRLDPAPDDYVPPRQDILLYQQLVGSYLYPTCMTRPDGSKAASMLATYLSKPSKAHIEAAKHAIQYLVGTKKRGIEFDGNKPKIAAFATDASYGDNPNRRSSEGYLMKLFGGPIDWRATKQRTVTTSTTEAELLAISEGAKQLIWWRRLFNSLNLHLYKDLSILCDNRQTVRLLVEKEPAFNTKLRHVDIHQHWLREKCQNGDINVEWIATDKQPADGLTKALSSAKHAAFVQHLGLIDTEAT